MKALRYSVVVLPRLDTEYEIQRLREKYDPWYYQVKPCVPVILPFTPATIDDLQGVSDYISLVRRSLHAHSAVFHGVVESGDRLLMPVEEGRESLMELHLALQGCETGSLVSEGDYEPRLFIARVPDPERRALALTEAESFGRTLGVISSMSMLRVEPDGERKVVANYPFGIGRVDFYEHFRASAADQA